MRHSYATETIRKIFVGNKDLCSSVPEKLISHIISCIETQGRKVSYLDILKSVVTFDGTPIRFSFLY